MGTGWEREESPLNSGSTDPSQKRASSLARSILRVEPNGNAFAVVIRQHLAVCQSIYLPNQTTHIRRADGKATVIGWALVVSQHILRNPNPRSLSIRSSNMCCLV